MSIQKKYQKSKINLKHAEDYKVMVAYEGKNIYVNLQDIKMNIRGESYTMDSFLSKLIDLNDKLTEGIIALDIYKNGLETRYESFKTDTELWKQETEEELYYNLKSDIINWLTEEEVE